MVTPPNFTCSIQVTVKNVGGIFATPCIFDNRLLRLIFAQSAGAVAYTDCHPAECPGYDTKQSDGEVSVMLGPWEMRSTPSLPLLPGPLWPGLVAPDRALSMG